MFEMNYFAAFKSFHFNIISTISNNPHIKLFVPNTWIKKTVSNINQ